MKTARWVATARPAGGIVIALGLSIRRLLQLPLHRSCAFAWSVFAVAVECSAVMTAQSALPPPAPEDAIIQSIDAAEQRRDSVLAAYTVVERYTIRNSHFAIPAEVHVNADYERGSGKTYHVVSRNGPSILKDRLMDRILLEETKMSREPQRPRSLITSENYEMRVTGEETLGDRDCLVIDLTPKRKDPYLLRGKLWVDARTRFPVRVQGQTAVSESFLAGRPQITRDYIQFDGVVLAQRSHASSSGPIQGKTDVTIVYDHYMVTVKQPIH